MITSLARTTILVRDYDEAIVFYKDTLGFETIVDLQATQGYRLVHLGLPSQPGVGIWLIQPAATSSSPALDGRPAASPAWCYIPTIVAAPTPHLRRAVCRFRASQPATNGAGMCISPDLYGNIIVLAELPAHEATAAA